LERYFLTRLLVKVFNYLKLGVFMLNLALASIVLLGLIAILSLSVAAGRRYGKNQLRKHERQLEVVIVAEGAVFTLLALLIAFAFSGAYQRFEDRKLHVIEEANVISTAYERIDLIAPAAQPALRNSFRDYIDAQIFSYKNTQHFRYFYQQLEKSFTIENKIWKLSVAACKETNEPSGAVTQLFLPAVNKMFDIEAAGMEISRVHPPLAIFALLIGLAALSGFLAGYSTAENETKSPLHVLCYILITAFTIYIIVDLEFPRVGLIRVDSFDQILVNLRDHMNE
jgi:hypothetical protein